MSNTKSPRYAAINLPHVAANGLRRLTAQLTAATGRRVTLGETLAALVHLGEDDPTTLAESLAYVRANRPTI